jgi:hypothetical protein
VLTELLHPLELTWTRRFHALIVTTPDEAETQLVCHVYDVRSLVSPEPKDALPPITYGELVDLLTSNVAPEAWDVVGGPGSAAVFDEMLVVAQTGDIHTHIRRLLSQLNELRRSQGAAKSAAPVPPMFVTIDVHETRLDDALQSLARQIRQRIVIEHRALDDVGLDASVQVSLRLAAAPLETALDLLLRQVDLTWRCQDDAIYVTTPEEAETRLDVRLYWVGDLLAGADQQAAADELREALTAIAADSWSNVGGPGSSSIAGGILVVAQTQQIHPRIEALLHDLRAASKGVNRGTPPAQ